MMRMCEVRSIHRNFNLRTCHTFRMCRAADDANSKNACCVQDLLPYMSVVLDRVSVTTTVGQSDLYVVQASDDLKQWEKTCAAMWNLYRQSDHCQECFLLKGQTEGQLFFCISPNMREVHSSRQQGHTEAPTCPLGKPLSLLLVLRPFNLWSGVVDDQGRKIFGATWSCEAFQALSNDMQADVL